MQPPRFEGGQFGDIHNSALLLAGLQSNLPGVIRLIRLQFQSGQIASACGCPGFGYRFRLLRCRTVCISHPVTAPHACDMVVPPAIDGRPEDAMDVGVGRQRWPAASAQPGVRVLTRGAPA